MENTSDKKWSAKRETNCGLYGHTSHCHIRKDFLEARLFKWDVCSATSQFHHLDNLHPQGMLFIRDGLAEELRSFYEAIT
jgi:hypothetical protein